MATTSSVCGDFTEAVRTDYGQCRPRRLKRDCRAHIIEIPGWADEDGVIILPSTGDCEDENLTTEYDAALTPPLRTIATIFDTDCEAVLDTDGEPITGPII